MIPGEIFDCIGTLTKVARELRGCFGSDLVFGRTWVGKGFHPVDIEVLSDCLGAIWPIDLHLDLLRVIV